VSEPNLDEDPTGDDGLRLVYVRDPRVRAGLARIRAMSDGDLRAVVAQAPPWAKEVVEDQIARRRLRTLARDDLDARSDDYLRAVVADTQQWAKDVVEDLVSLRRGVAPQAILARA
jgi:hypothetical protein